MKRIAILLAFILAAAGCTSHKGYITYCFTYDEVDVHAQPSDTSEVLMKAVCRRGDQFKDTVALFFDDRYPVPIGIREIDETGKWGRINERFPFVYNYHGWIKLSDVIVLGPMDKNTPMATYEATASEVNLYMHPKASDAEKILIFGKGFQSFNYKMEKGAKAQLLSKKGGWGFIRYVRYADSTKDRPVYGWVPMKNLRPVGDVTYESIAAGVAQGIQDKKLAQAQHTGPFFQWGIKHWNKVRPIFCKACEYGALLALIVAVICLVPSILRKRWMGTVLVLPVFAAYLFMVGSLSHGPGIVYGLAVPVLAVVVSYPLLYLSFLSRAVGTFIRISGIAGSLYVMFLVEFFAYDTLILHIFLLLLYITVAFKFTQYIAKKLEDDVCPNCGFYAGHDSFGEEYIGSSSTTEHSSYDVFDHSEKHGNVITNYYKTMRSSTTTQKDYYSKDRCCARCGYDYEVIKTRIWKERD